MDNARQHIRTLKSLTGKTALVTGASRGIGRAVAFALSSAGAQVIVHYARDETAANSVVAEIRANGGRAQTVMSDLAEKDGAHRLAEDTQEILGERLDILVANAGISLAADLEQTGVDQFDRLYAVNVRAPYFLVQQLLPSMFADSSIILISSLAARAAVGNLSAYAATKGAIESLVKYFAAALGEKGIRVNAVAPGVVETGMSNFTKTATGRHRTLSMQALKRIAQPADIADVIAFLASEEARWITGEIVHVDGGSTL
jgi:3-oxoacyl-[acyl-carrier protein] reductase